MNPRDFVTVLIQTFKEWREDKVPRLAAALSYYTAFSIAPLLIIVIALAGFFLGEEAARGQISNALGNGEMSEFLEQLLINANEEESGGIISTILSVATLAFGATGLFMQLQNALNEVWDIEQTGGFIDMIKDRASSFGLIVVIGFLLLVSLVMSSVIASLDQFLRGLIPAAQLIAQLITQIVSFGITTVLFGLIYKVLPDAEIKWKDVIIGAAFTAFLFSIGRWGLGLYLGNAGVASTYGAAGSFVLILLWVYYSAQIILFGAEFTQVYARRYGTKITYEGKVTETADAEKPDAPNAKAYKPAIPAGLGDMPVAPIAEPADLKPVELVTVERVTHPDGMIIIGSMLAAVGAVFGWAFRRIFD